MGFVLRENKNCRIRKAHTRFTYESFSCDRGFLIFWFSLMAISSGGIGREAKFLN